MIQTQPPATLYQYQEKNPEFTERKDLTSNQVGERLHRRYTENQQTRKT